MSAQLSAGVQNCPSDRTVPGIDNVSAVHAVTQGGIPFPTYITLHLLSQGGPLHMGVFWFDATLQVDPRLQRIFGVIRARRGPESANNLINTCHSTSVPRIEDT